MIALRTLAAILLASASLAASADCTKAVSPIDKAVCQNPDLAKADADLNRLYSDLRPQLTVKAKAGLLTQQRAWLAERNKACATADPACLRQQYTDRIDQLQAITASAKAAEGQLNDIAPVYLKGNWKVASIQDPAGKGHTDPAALKQSLSDANLSAPGTLVKALPGKLCLADDCGAMAWSYTTLAHANAGAAISRYLSLPPSARTLVGSSGSKESYYLLVPQPEGKLLAVFGLCGPATGQDCRQAAELWTPAAPDSTIYPKP